MFFQIISEREKIDFNVVYGPDEDAEETDEHYMNLQDPQDKAKKPGDLCKRPKRKSGTKYNKICTIFREILWTTHKEQWKKVTRHIHGQLIDSYQQNVSTFYYT